MINPFDLNGTWMDGATFMLLSSLYYLILSLIDEYWCSNRQWKDEKLSLIHELKRELKEERAYTANLLKNGTFNLSEKD